MLMQAGADPQLLDARCWSALELARSGGHQSVAVVLLGHRADARIKAGGCGRGGSDVLDASIRGEGVERREVQDNSVVVVQDQVVVVDANKK